MILSKLKDLSEKHRNHLIFLGAATRMDEGEAFQTLTDVVTKFAAAFQLVSKVLTSFEDIVYDHAQMAWRQHNEVKMPGSDRTARLRRKRRKAVLKWYFEVYLEEILEDW